MASSFPKEPLPLSPNHSKVDTRSPTDSFLALISICPVSCKPSPPKELNSVASTTITAGTDDGSINKLETSEHVFT